MQGLGTQAHFLRSHCWVQGHHLGRQVGFMTHLHQAFSHFQPGRQGVFLHHQFQKKALDWVNWIRKTMAIRKEIFFIEIYFKFLLIQYYYYNCTIIILVFYMGEVLNFRDNFNFLLDFELKY